MTTVKRRDGLLIDIFGKLLGFDFGVFTLRHGEHEVFVPTKIHPSSVWVKLHADKIDGCCQVPENEIGYTVHCDGITFRVKVDTEQCSVEWFAVS